MCNMLRLSAWANEKIQFGAYLAGKCLCEVSMALHHKMAHVLGGNFGLDHGSVHTVLLPYILAIKTFPNPVGLTEANVSDLLLRCCEGRLMAN